MQLPISLPFRWVRRVATMAAAGTGAAGGLGLVAFVQARLAGSRPGEQTEVDYWIDGDVGPADADTRRVVWLGDSLAAGLGAIAPDVSLPRLVAAHAPVRTRLHVYATPGATSSDVVRDQLPALEQLQHGLAQIGQRVDAVGATVGANDIAALTSRRRLRHNLRAIVAAADGAPVILVSIPELRDAIRLPHPLRTFASWRARWLDAVIRQIARTTPGVQYASVRERPAWLHRRHVANFLAADRYHPSGAGYGLWADVVAQAFDRAFHPAPAPAPTAG